MVLETKTWALGMLVVYWNAPKDFKLVFETNGNIIFKGKNVGLYLIYRLLSPILFSVYLFLLWFYWDIVLNLKKCIM